MSYYHNQNSLSKIFHIIDSNLSKFYSSRPQIQQMKSACSCKLREQQKKLQVNFYSEQRQMINKAGQILTQQQRTSDQKIIAKILFMAVDYLNKILYFLNQQFMCQCKKVAINESIVMKHKIQFTREQNNKYFKLLEQKSLECQKLQQKLKQIHNSQIQDHRPLTAKCSQVLKQKTGGSSSALIPKSANISSQQSVKSSKISESYEPEKGEIKQTFQKNHNMYFKTQMDKKWRKSKIFQQNL